MSERITLFAKILLPVPLPKLYTYRVPYEWNELIVTGLRVAVSFGTKKVYSGIVWEIEEEPPLGYQASYILEILDDKPIVTPSQMVFWKWMATYYMSFLGDVMAAALPAGYRIQSATKITLHPEFSVDDLPVLDDKENQILGMLLRAKDITVDQIQQTLNQKTVMKYVKSLYLKGVISMQEELKENYKAKWVETVELSDFWDNELEGNLALNTLQKRSEKQFEALMHLLGKARKPHSLKEILGQKTIDRAAFKALEKKGYILIQKQQIDHWKAIDGQGEAIELTSAQDKALTEIRAFFEKKQPVLLHGLTGSGKTHIYIKEAIRQLELGKQVLYLLPEVALTEHLVSRISQLLPVEMGVWHHFYSSSERTELYEKVRNRSINFVIGTRSAVFAPFVELGLIIVDEEHEPSYKQFEKRPLFNARDTAFYLAKQHQSHLLLGSATPSYEMMYLTKKESLGYVALNERYEQRAFAEWEWLNLKELKSQNRLTGNFSDPAKEALTAALKANQKIIVYHNRKGYAPYIECVVCGHTTQCIQCDISLTYYKSSNNQRCSYCGYHQNPPKTCPACGANDFAMKGTGTERMVEELKEIFPTARIARFDQQSIRKRTDFQKILTDFAQRNIDILVGTQLLAKGIDFEDVSLIVIPDADISLNIPDFRSSERAFQQLYQLAGRAGRGNVEGKVLVQTYRSFHPVYEALKNNDFAALSEKELESRETFHYPPYTRLIEIFLKHKDEQAVISAAMVFNNLIRPVFKDTLLGPITPSVSKIRNMYIQQFMIKLDVSAQNSSRVKQYLLQKKEELIFAENMNGVYVDFNVDPY